MHQNGVLNIQTCETLLRCCFLVPKNARTLQIFDVFDTSKKLNTFRLCDFFGWVGGLIFPTQSLLIGCMQTFLTIHFLYGWSFFVKVGNMALQISIPNPCCSVHSNMVLHNLPNAKPMALHNENVCFTRCNGFGTQTMFSVAISFKATRAVMANWSIAEHNIAGVVF